MAGDAEEVAPPPVPAARSGVAPPTRPLGPPRRKLTRREQLLGFVRDPTEGTSDRARAVSERMLDGPPVPPGCAYLVSWWHELAAGRPGGGMGLAPLTWPDLDAWAQRTGTTPTVEDCLLLLAGDRAFVNERSTTPEHPSDYDPERPRAEGEPEDDLGEEVGAPDDVPHDPAQDPEQNHETSEDG